MRLLINTDHLESMIFYIKNFDPETCKVFKASGGLHPRPSALYPTTLVIVHPPGSAPVTEPHTAQSIVKKYIVTVAKQPFCK